MWILAVRFGGSLDRSSGEAGSEERVVRSGDGDSHAAVGEDEPIVEVATQVAANNCKMVTQTVNVPGEGEQSEKLQACKGTDGNWSMTRV